MRRFWNVPAAALAVASVCCLWSRVVLADEEDGERRILREIRLRQTSDEGQYWLGLGLGEVSEALKTHLDFEGGVIVQQVVPGSPAEKAGVKTHDILLKFGEQDLGAVHDLLKAVRENENEENTITLLRKGKKQTLKIQPGERPDADVTLAVPHGNRDLRVIIGKWLEDSEGRGTSHPFRFGFVGPGVLAEGNELKLPNIPRDLQFSINKQGDSPAKIVVKQKDKTWEVTEDELDALPEAIRAHVKRMIGRGGATVPLRLKAFRRGDAAEEDDDDDDEDVVRRRGVRFQVRPLLVPEQLQEMKKSLEEMRRNFDGGTLKELRREIESLRREIEKLRESPSDKPEDV